MARYQFNEASVREIQRTAAQVKNLTRVKTDTMPDQSPVYAQPGDPVLIDFGKITAAGADSTHWEWKCSLRDVTTGAFTEGQQGSDELGECVIANGTPGHVGMAGLLYWQEDSDGDTVITLVPIGAVKFRARITAVSGSFPAWSYTVQRVTGYDSTLTGAARHVTIGVDITDVMNEMEFAPPAGTYPYTYGNGVTITDSDGTVNGGSCVIIPIGVGAVVDVEGGVDENGDPVWFFSRANSAEEPEEA